MGAAFVNPRRFATFSSTRRLWSRRGHDSGFQSSRNQADTGRRQVGSGKDGETAALPGAGFGSGKAELPRCGL